MNAGKLFKFFAAGLLSSAISSTWAATINAEFESGSKWYGYGSSMPESDMQDVRDEVQSFLSELGSHMASDATITVYFTDDIVDEGNVNVAAEAGSNPISNRLDNGESLAFLAPVVWRRINKGYSGHGVIKENGQWVSLPNDADAYVNWNFIDNTVPSPMNLKFLLRHEILHALGATSLLELCADGNHSDCDAAGTVTSSVSAHDLKLYYGDAYEKTEILASNGNGNGQYTIADYTGDIYFKGVGAYSEDHWIKVSSIKDTSHIDIMYDKSNTDLLNDDVLSYLRAVGYEIKGNSHLSSNNGSSGSSSAGSHECAIRSDNSLACWGNNTYGQANAPEGKFKVVSIGSLHTCAIDSDDHLNCWGGNAFGNINVDTVNSYRDVTSGNFDTCAIKDDGEVSCWGQGAWVAKVPGGLTFKTIELDNSHGCGLLESGHVKCWGYNGLGAANSPEGEFISVSVGGGASCAVNKENDLSCWGGDVRLLVSQMPQSGDFNSVSVGSMHACALRTDETVICWGADTITPPAGNFVEISSTGRHTCGRKEDNSIVCWGVDLGYDELNVPADL